MKMANSTAAARRTRKLFRDHKGRPSERSGPDLSKARAIGDVIKELGPMRNGHALAFRNACQESGIDLSVMRTSGGEDRLLIGCPMDTQHELRRTRLDALQAHLRRSERRRRDVIFLVNLLGRFADNQPYPSTEEAADAFLKAGGRIMVRPDGVCEETLPLTKLQIPAEEWEGYPIRRMSHRYCATMRRKGARDGMAALVRQRGQLQEGSGWIVLEAAPSSEKR